MSWFGRPSFPPWVVRWATHEFRLIRSTVNTLRPRQNGRHFADDIYKCIFLNENVWIPIKISLKFVPNGPINNFPALVQIMAWCRQGHKPLSEPMMVRLKTHITRPQWVKDVLPPSLETAGYEFRVSRPLKFDMYFGSSAVEEPVQFQIDERILKLNLAASRLHEISRLVVYWRGTGSDITSEIQAGVGLPSFKLDSTRWRYGKHEKWYADVDQFIIIV